MVREAKKEAGWSNCSKWGLSTKMKIWSLSLSQGCQVYPELKHPKCNHQWWKGCQADWLLRWEVRGFCNKTSQKWSRVHLTLPSMPPKPSSTMRTNQILSGKDLAWTLEMLATITKIKIKGLSISQDSQGMPQEWNNQDSQEIPVNWNSQDSLEMLVDWAESATNSEETTFLLVNCLQKEVNSKINLTLVVAGTPLRIDFSHLWINFKKEGTLYQNFWINPKALTVWTKWLRNHTLLSLKSNWTQTPKPGNFQNSRVAFRPRPLWTREKLKWPKRPMKKSKDFSHLPPSSHKTWRKSKLKSKRRRIKFKRKNSSEEAGRESEMMFTSSKGTLRSPASKRS